MADVRRRKPDNEGGEQINEDRCDGTEQPEQAKVHNKLHLKIAEANDQVNMKSVFFGFWINITHIPNSCDNFLMIAGRFRRRTSAR